MTDFMHDFYYWLCEFVFVCFYVKSPIYAVTQMNSQALLDDLTGYGESLVLDRYQFINPLL